MSNIKSFESIIQSQLKSLGYFSIRIQEENEESFNVIADGSFRKIFLRVLVRLVSEHINDLTNDEITVIKRNANTVNKEPWAAIMCVNENGELTDEIHWKNLAKQIA